jgi:hypothetical protein
MVTERKRVYFATRVKVPSHAFFFAEETVCMDWVSVAIFSSYNSIEIVNKQKNKE